jgi:uncharacterized protein YkwD
MLVRRLLILSLLVSGKLLTPLLGQEPAEAGPRTDASFVASTNALRAQRGLPKLRVSPTLSKLAYRHSVAMAKKDRLWHNDISSATDHWVWLAQNVGVGRSVASLQKAFMDSPTHRANILRRKANLVGGRHLHQQGQDLVTVNFEQTTPGGGPDPQDPLTAWRPRWHHRRALSWAASSVGRAPGF